VPSAKLIAQAQCQKIFKDDRTEPGTRAEALNIYLRLNGLLPALGRPRKNLQENYGDGDGDGIQTTQPETEQAQEVLAAGPTTRARIVDPNPFPAPDPNYCGPGPTTGAQLWDESKTTADDFARSADREIERLSPQPTEEEIAKSARKEFLQMRAEAIRTGTYKTW